MEKFKGKYIANNKIELVEEIEEKTYLDGKKVKIVFENESPDEILPLEVLEGVVTDEVSDATTLREKRVDPVVTKLLTILVESELGRDDLQYAIGPKLVESVNSAYDRADKTLWGKEHYDISLMDAEKILRKNRK